MNAVDGVFAHQRALEGHWRAIADRGMAASDIIKSLDEFKHGEFDFRLRLKRAPIEQFAFECGEKRLGHRVVVRIAHRTDGWHHTHFPAPLAEGEARVLAAVIGMMDHPTVGPTLREGHVDGRQHELGPQMILHRPTDHFARARIEHDRQEQKARPRREWSERPGVVELFPGLSAPNRTCTFQRIRLSISSVAHSNDEISVTRFEDIGLLIA